MKPGSANSIFDIVRRIISSILAILVLALSVLPCGEIEAQVTMPVQDCAGAIMNATNDDNCSRHHEDLCSPFCACACCAGIILPATVVLEGSQSRSYAERSVTAYILRRVESVALPV